MKELRPNANTRVETLVLEGQRETKHHCVEPDGRCHVGGPQLCYDVRYLHLVLAGKVTIRVRTARLEPPNSSRSSSRRGYRTARGLPKRVKLVPWAREYLRKANPRLSTEP